MKSQCEVRGAGGTFMPQEHEPGHRPFLVVTWLYRVVLYPPGDRSVRQAFATSVLASPTLATSLRGHDGGGFLGRGGLRQTRARHLDLQFGRADLVGSPADPIDQRLPGVNLRHGVEAGFLSDDVERCCLSGHDRTACRCPRGSSRRARSR